MGSVYHNGMTVPYEKHGRTGQKSRTREMLISATRGLLSQGQFPTVEEAATSASISRTTAYRYFPNQHSLLAATHPEVEARSLLGPDASEDPAARLNEVVEAIARLTLETEPQLRAALRVSLEPGLDRRHDLPLRRGRRIVWVEDALAPLRRRIPASRFRRLVVAIAAVVGIDALVWLTDVARLTRDEAVETMKWSASALLQSELGQRTVATDLPASRRKRDGPKRTDRRPR